MITYVFGAGASVHAGYPFAKSMGDQLVRWLETHDDVGPFEFKATAQFLRQRFGSISDIEEVLTRIDETIAAGSGMKPRPTEAVLLCNCYKPALIAAIRMWFQQIRGRAPRDYARFAEFVANPGDCMITFNYDVALESQLQRFGKWRLGDGYGFRLGWDEPLSSVLVLKLHGSVNWRFPVGWNGRPWIDANEVAFLGYPGRTDPLYGHAIADGAGTMILPARCKQFFVETSLGRVHEHFWDMLWARGKHALTESEKIVLCGYSAPEVDIRACSLLMGGKFSAPVEVCCGDDTANIVERLRASGRNAHAAQNRYFNEWIDCRQSFSAG